MLRLLESVARPAVALLLAVPLGAMQDPFAVCEDRLGTAPGDRQSAACYYLTARDTGAWESAWQRLRAHLERTPDSPWLHYYLGNVGWGERRPEVAGHYREAARLLQLGGHPSEEVEARLNLAAFVRIIGRLEEARTELEGARLAATTAGDPVLLTRVDLELARLLLDSGRELGRSYRLLRSVEATAFPDGAYLVQRDCLAALGTIAYILGRFDEALRYRRRFADLAAAAEDRYAEASALHDLAITELATARSDDERDAVVKLVEKTLEIAVAAGHRTIEARSHRLLGRLLGGSEGLRHLESCAEITRTMGENRMLSECQRALAAEIASAEPARAERLLDEALALALESQDPWGLVYAWLERKEVRWSSRAREEALDDSLQTLQAIESLRSLQSSTDDRMAFLSAWSDAYSWLAGRLLSESRQPARADLVHAFALAERTRGRGLLETLAEERRRDTVDPALRERHAEELRQIVSLNRRLLSAEISPEERRTTMEELSRHELVERELRQPDLPERETLPVAFATLDEVEAQLDEHQAMLSFQLAEWTDIYGDFAGGSWLLVSTRQGTSAYRQPPPSQLEPAVEIFLGLVQRRQDLETTAAAGLYDTLLAAAMADLPATVEELLVIPDGVLHRLPFAALRRGAEEPPLGASHRLTHIPSATLWLQWESRPAATSQRPPLVLADPALPSSGNEAAAKRAWSLALGPRLGALPHARREGRSVARILSGRAQLLEGAEASEHELKARDLSRFGVLHFATHAVVDDEWPERSAVMLAAGAASEDGLLQAREIVDLPLEGQLVVLSACRSGGGAVLKGEGAMSLARAFFAAGAHAVVASLWPLRDDEAASLVRELYAQLVRGRSTSEALAAAGRALAEGGAPTASWAGLVLLGDGELKPVPAREPGLRKAWVTGLLFVTVAAPLVWWARRRTR